MKKKMKSIKECGFGPKSRFENLGSILPFIKFIQFCSKKKENKEWPHLFLGK